MENRSVYALLIGVGNYDMIGVANLPTYKMDLMLLGTALLSKLKVPGDNIRLMAGENKNGYLTTMDLARAIAVFQSLLKEESTFIFYFSGHGSEKSLIFSNGEIHLQSVIDFVDRLPAKNKIVILDCCYSGNFKTSGARQMHFQDSVSDFAGHGIAVMASSAADEVSRLDPSGSHSIFTGALSTAIAMNNRVRKGRLSLADINEEMQKIIEGWNKKNPGKEQHPIFRSSMGGTIFFQVEEYRPYQQKTFQRETNRYKIVEVKPLSAQNIKRLCAFVIPKGNKDDVSLAALTKEIAGLLKYEDIYSTKASENRWKGTPARAIWCYFGLDESDMINHRYYAYTIWAGDEEMESFYFQQRKDAVEIDGIYLVKNIFYSMVKKLQVPVMSREEFIEENKKWLSSFVSMAEEFIVDLQEVYNKTISIEEMQNRYGDWIRGVRKRYIQMSDGDMAPDDLHDWMEEISNLAGCVLDLSLLLENEKENGSIGERQLWLMNHAIRRYHESLEQLKRIERTSESDSIQS